MKNVVVLGGSYGGLSAAHCFLKHTYPELSNKDDYQLVLISISSQVTSRPAAPRAIIADDLFDQKKLWVDIPPLLDQYPRGSFRFVKGAATGIDLAACKVTVALAGADNGAAQTEVVDFYALVVATGATTTSPLMGFNHHDEVYLKQRYAEFRAALATAKSIVICGGGTTGIEAAGELGEHFNGLLRSWWPCAPKQPAVAVTVVTSSQRILPLQPPHIAARAESLLANVGVTVIKETKVTSVAPITAGTAGYLAEPAHVVLSDGRELDADIYIPAVGYRPNTDFLDPALLAEDGRIKTDSHMRVIGAGPRIYAIGDCSDFSRPAVHLIQGAVPVLAVNMKRDILADAGNPQSGDDRTFEPETSLTQMVPIGRSKGVGSFNGYSVPSLMVWALKGRDYWVWTTPEMWTGKKWDKI